MKFARYLDDSAVVEWKRAYINYRGLKRLIKQVAVRHQTRTSLELQKAATSESTGSAFEGLRRRALGKGSSSHRVSGVSYDARNTLSEEDDGAARPPLRERERSGQELPQVNLATTGLAIASQSTASDVNAADEFGPDSDDTRVGVEPAKAGKLKGSRTGPYDKRDLEAQRPNTASTLASAGPSRIAEASLRTPEPAHFGSSAEAHLGGASTRNASQDASKLAGNGKEELKGSRNKKGGKKSEKHRVSLDQLIADNFDNQESKFFSALEFEHTRIVDFFEARENEAHKKFELLARQLRELADHRREYKAMHPPNLSDKVADKIGVASIIPVAKRLTRGLDSPRSSLPPAAGTALSPNAKNEGKVDHGKRRAGDAGESQDEGDRRRSLALRRLLDAGNDSDVWNDEELRKQNRAAAMSHDPQRYTAARKKLKAAVLEFYRGLELLKNYRVVNSIGVRKILKKFEKATGVPGINDAWYHVHVSRSVLVTSDSIERLIKGTEEIYSAYFEHGNRKRAVERLRVNAGTGGEEHHTHHMSASRTGFYLGVAVCAAVAGLVEAEKQGGSRFDIPQWDQLLRVYGALFLPTLFALLFGLNLATWHRARINTSFIFEFDVRHAMDHRQWFEIPAFLLLLLAVAFWISFLNPFPRAIAPTTWPLVWLVIVVLVLLNPLPINLPHSRQWFVRSLVRVFAAGLLFGVEFRDFFIGDELNSLAWPISNLWVIGCEYNKSWRPPTCNPNGTFWTAALSSLPALLRLGQCIRRFEDSKRTAYLHLVNAAKYTAGVIFYWSYLNYRYHGSGRQRDLIFWCFFATLYSLYAGSWDLLMDWSVLRPRAKHWMLRDEITWPPAFYYFAIISNTLLRFSWTIYLFPGPASATLKVFIIALLEALRRLQWNVFRLENEHLGNVDMYRTTRETPLPYRIPAADAVDEVDDLPASKRWLPLLALPAIRKLRRKQAGEVSTGADSESSDEPEQASRPPPAKVFSGSHKAQKTSAVLPISTERPQGQRSVEVARSERQNQGAPVLSKSRLLDKLHDKLVPDRGGYAVQGPGITDQGAAHGAQARDYQPRAVEVDGASRLSTDDGDSDAALDDSDR
ncbi:EXS-domain-containing protein [Ceraceosorus guamensis]|uniref:EXS-domain-containing protein n=1 Tax=Ceraceosorus guamensis TaxID=1522189 RepID=A0A316W230_9BASI|nr:EXS-domain-containing protein [Ceraceosorus guamensis]PWN43947.1 EXS-domain-containing protein [Ceraceosorus guamensis]